MSNSKIEFEDRLKKGLPFEKKLIDRGEIELEYFKMSANPNKKDKIHGDIFVRNRNEIIIAAIDAKFTNLISLSSITWFFGFRNKRKHRAIFMLENGIMNNSDEFREFIREMLIKSFPNLDLNNETLEVAATKVIDYAKNRYNIDLGNFIRLPSNDLGICFDELPDRFKNSKENWQTKEYWNTLKSLLKY